MRTYARILDYASPFRKCAFYYFFATLLSIIFGLVSYGLVMPLLKVLFNQEELSRLLVEAPVSPQWQISIGSFMRLLHEGFIQIIIHFGTIGALYWLAFLFMASHAISVLFSYTADIAMAKVRNHLIYNLRLALFKKSVELPVQYFTDTKRGEVMARITVDIQEIESAMADAWRLCLKDPTQLFCNLIVLFYLSPKLSLFTLLFVLIVGWAIAQLIQSLRKWTDERQKSLGNVMNFMEEMISGMAIIKMFSAQKYAVDQLRKEGQLYARTHMAMVKKSYMMAPLSASLSVAAIAIILAYGGHLILLNRSMLTPSAFITYIIIGSQTLIPIKMIARSIGHMQRGIAAGRRILDVLDEKPALTPAGGAPTLFQASITFTNVSFAYNNGQEVLHQINFTIHKGETLALVGASGSGKSTLVSLLAGLYQPNQGTITIDDLPIAQISPPSLHRLIGVVPQESILFHDTIFNNIVLHRPGFSMEAVVAAAQVAGAHHFIMHLPQAYHTIIGAKGNKLSGGQKQCICIARAILGNPPILVLDEATSALDSDAERNVHKGLQLLIKNKTSIVVAHRLSTICHADHIIVLAQGSIVEQGTHTHLLAKAGAYKQLFVQN